MLFGRRLGEAVTLATMTEATAGTEGPPRSPVREVLGERNFRAFFIAQVLLFGVGGTLRFTFIWLVVTLTDWPSAEGLVAFCLGVPAMLLSVPAGAWSDRLDRRKLFVGGIASTTVMLVVFTAAIAAGWVTTFWAAVAALVIGTPSAITLPTVHRNTSPNTDSMSGSAADHTPSRAARPPTSPYPPQRPGGLVGSRT